MCRFEIDFGLLRGIPKKMCAKMILYRFSLTVIALWIGVSAEEEVSSPLRVAQCRATCLQKVCSKITYNHQASMTFSDKTD